MVPMAGIGIGQETNPRMIQMIQIQGDEWNYKSWRFMETIRCEKNSMIKNGTGKQGDDDDDFLGYLSIVGVK